jgi:hypothetical protein
MKSKLFFILFLTLFLISFVSSSSFAYNYLESTNPTGTTDLSNYYTIIEVNNINTSMKNYVDSVTGGGGITWATAMNGTLAKTSDLTNYVSYTQLWLQVYNKTEISLINDSMRNYVLYVNSTNGAGGGSSGGGFNPLTYNPTIKRQLAPLSTNDNVTWSSTDMYFNLVGGIYYNLACDILFTGAAAGTGQVINVSNNGSYSNVNVMYDTWSSATANVGLSASVFNTALTGTGSGAAIIRPNLIIADWNQTSNGTLILRIRSEVFGSATQIDRGSLCKLYNVGDLQQFLNPIIANNTPAIRRQTVDINSTNSTNWIGNNMFFTVQAGKTYNLMCDILYQSANAGTGMVINLTTNISYSNTNIVYDTWSSATASVGLSASVFNTALTGTGSGLGIVKPNGIFADFNATTGGIVNVSFRTEVNASACSFKRGSMCYLYEVG